MPKDPEEALRDLADEYQDKGGDFVAFSKIGGYYFVDLSGCYSEKELGRFLYALKKANKHINSQRNRRLFT